MMPLYIDPGTGSMLLTIMIGIFGTLYYVLRLNIVKLKMRLSLGKSTDLMKEKLPMVIFSDDKRYWNVFEPICRKLNEKDIDIVYMTASPDDPALTCGYDHVEGRFIGEGNKAFAKLNFLNAKILLSTTPGLDVYQWKRSKDVDCYIHMLHAASDVTLYRMFGLDYYDAVMLSGEYQAKDIRNLEKIRNLPEKELVKVGIPYMDEMVKRLQNAKPIEKSEKIVLLAPSWGPNAIFARYGGKIIDALLKTDYHIIIRPHPQSFTSEKEMMDDLMKAYPESDRLEWNRDNDNFEVLRKSDILISDFSGVVFDFTLVYDKPVIYTEAEFDKGPFDAWWLDTPYWTETALPRLGEILTEENIPRIGEVIEKCLADPKYAKGREEARQETWEYMGEGTDRAVDYLLSKYDELEATA